MSGISWSNDNYFLQVGMDSNGGTNFITMGTTQLLSVPYALHAKTADSVISSGGTGSNCGTCFTHFIGEQYGGGVIFHLWKDAQSIEHGLVVDLVNLSDSQIWSDLDTVLIGPSAQSFWDGLNNSLSIVAQQGHTNSAALLCLNSNNAGQNDWYLPSIQELNLLWNNSYNVERSLSQIAGATSLGNREYWSSTEFDDLMSCFFAFDLGTTSNGLFIYRYKNDYHEVRAVRAF